MPCVYFLVVYVLFLDDPVNILDDVFVELRAADFSQLLGKVPVGKAKGTFVAGDEYDVLIIIRFLLDDAAHVLVHIGSDQNVDSSVFGCFWVFLWFEVIFSNPDMA